jgi:hypothetical protein
MKKLLAWLVAGVVASALAYLILFLLARAHAPHLWVPALAGDEGLRFLGIQALWGAAYGLVFWALAQHILPKEVLPSGLIFALLPFLVAALLWPLYRHRPAMSEPWDLIWLAVDNACFSVLMVALGRQFEK